MTENIEDWPFSLGFVVGMTVGVIIAIFVGRTIADDYYRIAYRDYKADKIEETVKKSYPELWIEYNAPLKDEKK